MSTPWPWNRLVSTLGIDLSGKKVVVTGASGFIGSRLVKELLDSGALVTALGRRDSDLWRLGSYADKIAWDHPDFLDLDALETALRVSDPDFIFHLATYYSVDNNVDFSEIIDTNIKVGALLVQAAGRLENLKLFINTGTCAEYGDLREEATEEAKLAPNTIYAATKAAASLILHQIADDQGVPMTTLRLYNLYGEFEGARRFVPYIILSLLRGEDVQLTGCEQSKDYSYVGDFVEAFLLAALGYRKAVGEILNIGSGKAVQMKELVDAIAAALPESRSNIKYGARPYRENEMWHQSTSIEQAREHLDWQPQTSLQEGIKKTVDWYKQNRHLYHG